MPEASAPAETRPAARPARLRVQDALKNVPNREGMPYSEVFCHGTMSTEIYAPRGTDEQTVHNRDEVYIVVAGSGRFFNGTERHPFGPGDMLFVPAGTEHRFEDFSEDFVTWVVFFGPDGGEDGKSHTVV